MQFDPLLPLPVIGVMAGIAAAFVVARARRGAPIWALARGAAMVVLATVIAVDPALTGGSSEARRAAADVLFVVDTTSSMAALDYGVDAPRLDGVRADIVELAAEFPGAHFSLIRFDSQARLELPWTTDLGALETAVSVLRQERAMYSRGSRLDLPLQVIDEQLPRPSAATGDDGSYSVVFYFSDGEVRRGADTEDPAVDRQTGVILPDDDERAGDQLVRRAGTGRRRWRRVRLRHRRRGADAPVLRNRRVVRVGATRPSPTRRTSRTMRRGRRRSPVSTRATSSRSPTSSACRTCTAARQVGSAPRARRSPVPPRRSATGPARRSGASTGSPPSPFSPCCCGKPP